MVGLDSMCKTPTTEAIVTNEIRLPNSDTISIHLNVNAPMLLVIQAKPQHWPLNLNPLMAAK